ncbi:hypothetical protein [Caulobacter sp. CCG-8]|uniref:hypothetical protein n=1 Tax=Caulobacter sp. CCG-8 TaxID=3127958 RepID=UPI00307DCE9A
MKCAQCKFWIDGNDGSSEDEPFSVPGECRRKAPTPFLVPHDEPSFGRGQAYWPQTGHDDFCGEFVSKAEKRVGWV